MVDPTTLVNLRTELGLPPLAADAVPEYLRQVKKQNANRMALGLDPLPLVLRELREVMNKDQLAAFMERFTSLKQSTSQYGCPAYAAAMEAGEPDRRIKARP